MIRQGAGELDLAEIAADAELLDLLAARAETTSDDPVARMLAAFAAEVDDGLDALLESDSTSTRQRQCRRPTPVAVPAQRTPVAVPARPCSPHRPCVPGRRGMRATTVALVVAGTLSVSGVAAAVTGDPFAPYRSLVAVVTGGGDGRRPGRPGGVAAAAARGHARPRLRTATSPGRARTCRRCAPGWQGPKASAADSARR